MKKKTVSRNKCETTNFSDYPFEKTSPHLRKQIRSFLEENLKYYREMDADELTEDMLHLCAKYNRRLKELTIYERELIKKNGVGI